MNEKLENFKKYYSKAMSILDDINELISDIDWDIGEDTEMTIRESTLLKDLMYKMEDCEAQLSDSLYDEMYEVYNEESEED